MAGPATIQIAGLYPHRANEWCQPHSEFVPRSPWTLDKLRAGGVYTAAGGAIACQRPSTKPCIGWKPIL